MHGTISSVHQELLCEEITQQKLIASSNQVTFHFENIKYAIISTQMQINQH